MLVFMFLMFCLCAATIKIFLSRNQTVDVCSADRLHFFAAANFVRLFASKHSLDVLYHGNRVSVILVATTKFFVEHMVEIHVMTANSRERHADLGVGFLSRSVQAHSGHTVLNIR